MPVTLNRNLPLHDDRSRSWDGRGARSRMADMCETAEGVAPDCMGQGFIWRWPDEDATNIGAYSLPVADVIDGQRRIVFSGVTAAARSVSPAGEPGAARSLNATESQLSDMRSAIAALYRRFADHFDDDSIRAPWEESTTASGHDENDEDHTMNNATTAASTLAAAADTASAEADTATASTELVEDDVQVDSAQEVVVSYAPAIRASGSTLWRPPAEHFTRPDLEGAVSQKIQVEDDGRVWGRLAMWNQAHIGYEGERVYPPRDPDGSYRYYMKSSVLPEGASEEVRVGLITMNTGHAAQSLNHRQAAAHYDHTGTITAAVHIGEDDEGIWFSGSALPGASKEDLVTMHLADISGDWRIADPKRGYELVAALSVPFGGFPVPRSQFSLAASGESGALPVPREIALLASSTASGPYALTDQQPFDQASTFISIPHDVVSAVRTSLMASVIHSDVTPHLVETITEKFPDMVQKWEEQKRLREEQQRREEKAASLRASMGSHVRKYKATQVQDRLNASLVAQKKA